MSVLERLKEKIDDLKIDFRRLKVENQELKSQIDNATDGNTDELESLRKEITDKNEYMDKLKAELAEKDDEIEAIISKVEALMA
ncbi:MAG TPA: hypothetical protein EYG98_01320 [Sulfurovum sp.]|nr:hypothetical protein [Sulfurovum sp.]